MAAPQVPDAVKLFVAVLWHDATALERAHSRMQALWGPSDYVGPDRLFDATDYYVAEMGAPLYRRMIGFRELIAPEAIVEIKLAANALEVELTGPAGRSVNLDAGYLDHNKVVLASAKNAGQKIHLGRGIYADLVARYSHGRYQPFEWTFPDFKTGRYDDELAELRQRYLQALRSTNRSGGLQPPLRG